MPKNKSVAVNTTAPILLPNDARALLLGEVDVACRIDVDSAGLGDQRSGGHTKHSGESAAWPGTGVNPRGYVEGAAPPTIVEITPVMESAFLIARSLRSMMYRLPELSNAMEGGPLSVAAVAQKRRNVLQKC